MVDTKKATAIIYTPFYLDKWVHLFAYQPSRNHSTLGFVASTFPKAHSGSGKGSPFLDYEDDRRVSEAAFPDNVVQAPRDDRE